jgi:hypothetical protein
MTIQPIQPKPVTDLSPRVVRLARLLDRLERDGVYLIRLEKPASDCERWKVSIDSVKTVREMEA